MPSDYTGDPTGITAHQVPVVSCPVGTDAPVAASVNTPLKKLADILAQLMRDAALLGVANTITAENAFTDANPLKFMRSGDQTLTKDVAGVLSIVNLVHAVVIRAAAGHNAQLLSAGGALIQAMPAEINVNAFPITGVADPTNAQDVATMAYVLGLVTPLNAAPTRNYITSFLNSWISFGTGSAPGYYKDAQGIVHLFGGIKNGTIGDVFDLPAGFRSSALVRQLAAGGSADVDMATIEVNPGTNRVSVFNATGSNHVRLDGIAFLAD
jgi:hypothetical protein